MRVCRRTQRDWRGEREREKEREGEKKRNPTSNHNLALCRVVSLRLEEALRNEFVRFGGLSCPCARRRDRVQRNASIFSRLKFMAGIHGATLRRLTGVYPFNLFYGRWMLMQMAGMKKMVGERRGVRRESDFVIELWTAETVNEFPNGKYIIYSRGFHHLSFVRTCHRQINAVLSSSLFLKSYGRLGFYARVAVRIFLHSMDLQYVARYCILYFNVCTWNFNNLKTSYTLY